MADIPGLGHRQVLRHFKRSAKPPANAKNLHRQMSSRDTLEDAFTWRAERTLSQALTIQHDKVMFILDPTEEAHDVIGKRVEALGYPDGRLTIRYKDATSPAASSTISRRSSRPPPWGISAWGHY